MSSQTVYECVCVCYLAQSNVHLINQVDIEFAGKFLQLLIIRERLCPPHLVTYDPHHCMLQTENIHKPLWRNNDTNVEEKYDQNHLMNP